MALVAAPAAALAGTVTLNGSELRWIGGTGTNTVSITKGGFLEPYVVEDTTSPVSAGSGCSRVTDNKANCGGGFTAISSTYADAGAHAPGTALSVTPRTTTAAKTARKLNIGRKVTTLGSGSAAASQGGKTMVTLKLTAKAKRALKRARFVRLTLVVVATDRSGNQSRATRKTVTVRR